MEDFTAAVNAADWARALELYGGDFLAGFHLPAAPAFESWRDAWRGHLRADAVGAAQRLADEQENAGEYAAAIASPRKALRIAPTEERLVRRLMTLLQRSGARAAALSVFRKLEDVLRVELDAAPEEETRELAVRIRGSSAIRSLAVLPWANLTVSPDQEHVADGLTGLVITELARTDVARITSRQSSLLLKGATIPLDEVGRRLCVDAVIEGSVSRNGDWLSVTAQLIRLEPEEHLWAERFEAAFGELPRVAERIARAVAAWLRGDRAAAVAAATAREASTLDAAALEAYLRARHFSVMLPQLGKAIVAYRDAIERAPDFAPAWAGLASAYAILTLLAHASPAELFPTFRRAAELGESAEAVAAARLGIELLPDNAEALALGIAALGRSGHATAAAEPLAQLLALGEFQDLDPWAVGTAYAGLGDRDQALRWFRRMYDERSPSAFCIAYDPLLDPLRDEPRFRDLIRRLAFPPAAGAGRL